MSEFVIEHQPELRHQYSVRVLRTMLTVLLAVAWMPLAGHCQIEHVTGLQFLRCAPADADGAPCSPADGGSCCSWESGQYHLPESQPLVAVPLVAVVPLLQPVAESWTPAECGLQDLTEAPPGPPEPWQFSSRAALPVRAPSIAS
jgi:hypothetical protein